MHEDHPEYGQARGAEWAEWGPWATLDENGFMNEFREMIWEATEATAVKNHVTSEQLVSSPSDQASVPYWHETACESVVFEGRVPLWCNYYG